MTGGTFTGAPGQIQNPYNPKKALTPAIRVAPFKASYNREAPTRMLGGGRSKNELVMQRGDDPGITNWRQMKVPFAEPATRPHTFPWHMGPGNERGQPYWECGQVYHGLYKLRDANNEVYQKFGQANVYDPTHSSVAYQRTAKTNDPAKEDGFLLTYNHPDSHRSCKINYNSIGGTVNSSSHYAKIGSKHLSQPSHLRNTPMTAFFDERNRRNDTENPVGFHPQAGAVGANVNAVQRPNFKRVWDLYSENTTSSEQVGNWTHDFYRRVNENNPAAVIGDRTAARMGLTPRVGGTPRAVPGTPMGSARARAQSAVPMISARSNQ